MVPKNRPRGHARRRAGLTGRARARDADRVIARRGSRPIVVDGHSLRWWVRRRGLRGCYDCDECTVIIAHESRTGAIVQAFVPEAWKDDVAITPAQIAAIAREALAGGWVPGQGDGVVGARIARPPG